ncbi:MAG: elongation factor P [Phycisphaera sp.]|nr:elongation factor P [Phycisphaera sp.]
MAVNIDGNLFIITHTDHVKPGKGPAYVQVKIKSVATGNVAERRLRTVEDIDQAILDRRVMQYLYSDSSGHVFMDNESYEQYTLPADLLGDAMLYLKANTDINVLVYEGRPITIDLPKSVELEVTDTAPQVKGATATNQLKEAELETGLKTRVPPFIENGQVIKVSTEDASYMGRAGG